MNIDKGIKFDTEKPRMDMVLGNFPRALYAVSEVGTYGANKYTDNGWEEVDNGIERYLSAMLRHYFAYKKGEVFDRESELSHLAHMAWNALVVLELQERSVHEPHECNCKNKCHCESVKEHDYNSNIDDDVRSIMYSFYGYDDIE